MPSNPDETVIAIPEHNIDKVIGANEFTFTMNDALQGFSTGFGQIVDRSLIRAIYSYDGGVTWNDVGVYMGWSGFDIDPAVAVEAYTDPSNGQAFFSIQQTALVNGGNDYALTIKFALLAPYDLAQFNTDYSYFSGLNAYNSGEQYLDIAEEGSFVVSSASSTVTVVPHSLNMYPFCEVFIEETVFGNTTIRQLPSNPGNAASPGDSVRVGLGELTIRLSGRSPTRDVKVYYKIYRED